MPVMPQRFYSAVLLVFPRVDVWQLVALAAGVLFTLYFGYRRLAFDSFDSVGSAAQGLKSKYISIYFLLILAVSVSIGAQIVGSLLGVHPY